MVREFPVVAVTGPRQSGKTTMLRRLFGERRGYVSLETPDVRQAAETDPRAFLEFHPPPVIYDDIQYVPSLLPYIKERVDADRDRPGQYVLTGSQNLLLAQGVTESLAGRAAFLKLLPLSCREAAGRPGRKFIWERRGGGALDLSYEAFWRSVARGGYPELVADPRRDATPWHAAYVQTYLERDVRLLRNIGDLTQFQAFLRALAARSAQLLNMANLARDLGLAPNTVKTWLSVLEATHQVFIVRPWFVNRGKRLVKTPKVYLADTGTLCYLTGLRDPEHARNGPMAGAIMETAVLTEIMRGLTHRGEEPQVYFWRTTAGAEVDFVIEVNGRVVPIEVKVSSTPKPAMARGIAAFQKDYADRAAKGYVIHPGDMHLPLGPEVEAVPFSEL